MTTSVLEQSLFLKSEFRGGHDFNIACSLPHAPLCIALVKTLLWLSLVDLWRGYSWCALRSLPPALFIPLSVIIFSPAEIEEGSPQGKCKLLWSFIRLCVCVCGPDKLESGMLFSFTIPFIFQLHGRPTNTDLSACGRDVKPLTLNFHLFITLFPYNVISTTERRREKIMQKSHWLFLA